MKNRSTTKKTLQLYWQHSLQHRRLLTWLIVLMPIIQFIDDFISPYLISQIMNKLAKATGPIDLHVFMRPLLIVLILELSVNFLWRPYVKLVWTFEEKVMSDLYNTSFAHLMKMGYRFYSNRFAGSLVSQVNKLSGSFERLSDTLIWNVYKLIIAFVFTVVLLAKPAPLYVLVLVSFSLIYLVLLLKIKRTERPFNERWAAAETRRTGQLADSISNIMAVKAFAHEDIEKKLFAGAVDRVYDSSMATMRKVLRNEKFTTTAQRSINAGAILSALYLASKLQIPVGTIYLVLVYTLAIIRRLWDFNNTLRNINRVFGDAYDMTEILSIEPEIQDAPGTNPLQTNKGEISFDSVTFAYPEKIDTPLFNNLNMHINPGEKVGLVGHSGGGKTTITQLILRFMDVQQGSIEIDSQNISSVTQDSLRKAIAYVPQEPLMFHRSIADNIRYGNSDASDKAVKAAAKMAHAHEFIEQLAEGYETLVGERGVKLSGGQRQRIAIARAMLKNAPILVLDEATSALDSESEVLIQDALWKLMEGRTAIVIAHRLSTIQKMDRILVMDDGKIVEEGTHKELVAKAGVYASLWAHQSGGFIEE